MMMAFMAKKKIDSKNGDNIHIEIVNATQRRVAKKLIKKLISAALLDTMREDKISLILAFITKSEIRALNRVYYGKDAPCDVLSFSYDKKFPFLPVNGKFIGEVFVCPDVVEENSAKMGLSFERELAHVIIHGTLHLVGYDHEDSEKKRLKMHAIEEKIMDSFLAS